MGSKLKISPSLFNHLYDSNNPKILAPTPCQYNRQSRDYGHLTNETP